MGLLWEILGEPLAQNYLVPGPVEKDAGHLHVQQFSVPSEGDLHINTHGPLALWVYRNMWKAGTFPICKGLLEFHLTGPPTCPFCAQIRGHCGQASSSSFSQSMESADRIPSSNHKDYSPSSAVYSRYSVLVSSLTRMSDSQSLHTQQACMSIVS